MKFNANNNRIYIQDDNGNYIFDTNMKMPAIIEVINKNITLTEIGTLMEPEPYSRVLYNIKNLGYMPDFLFSTMIIQSDRWGNITLNISGSLFYEYAFKYISIIGCRLINLVAENNILYLEEERGYFNYRGKGLWWTLPSVGVSLTAYVGRFV